MTIRRHSAIAFGAALAVVLLGAVLWWNRSEAMRVHQIDDNAQAVLLLPDRQLLAFFPGGRVQQYDLRDGEQPDPGLRATGGHLSADQSCVLIAGPNVIQWDIDTQRAVSKIQAPAPVKSALALPDDLGILIAAGAHVYRWDGESLDELEHFQAPRGAQREFPQDLELRLSDDGTRALLYVRYL